MPHWFLKTILLLALLVLDIVIGAQIFEYWSGMAYFPLVGTLSVAALQAALVLVLVYIHVLLFQFKKA